MEPALKVACDRGSNQRIAVWATELTLSEKKFANLMDRFKDEHHIVKVPCPKLVRMVEDDKLDDTNLVESVLKEYLAACDYKNLDSIVPCILTRDNVFLHKIFRKTMSKYSYY